MFGKVGDIRMNVVNTVKNAAFSTAVSKALNYLEKDPETNIPKVMHLIDNSIPDNWYSDNEMLFGK
mgnify:CR=1 FL=1